jgi:hypothetical protein
MSTGTDRRPRWPRSFAPAWSNLERALQRQREWTAAAERRAEAAEAAVARAWRVSDHERFD